MLCEPASMKDGPLWWNLFFDDHFADVFLERETSGNLAKEVDFIINELQLKPGQTVFDQCCGTGDLSCALAAKHIDVVGVDQSQAYIERAQAKAEKNQLSCDFHRGDALEFCCPNSVDAGFNWYTSFGYSDNDTINLKMLKNSFHSLKKGGRFVLDYNNPAYIFKNFKDHVILKSKLLQGEFIVNKHSQVDLQRGMLISRWHYILPDGTEKSKSGESRIYFARDLCEMLASCGFNIIGLKGDISGTPLTKDSPRCIITAQK